MKRIPERDAAIAAGKKTFFTGKPCRHGHIAKRFVSSYGCVECAAIRRDSTYQAEYRRKNADAIANKQKLRYAKNAALMREKSKRWYEQNKETAAYQSKKRHAEKREEILEYQKKWRLENRDRVKANATKEYKENRHLYIARSRARQQAIRNRTPSWADLDHIRDFYELARIATECSGFAFEVDHIIPLQGERVSGLHEPRNLSVLLRSENRAKSNRFHEERP